MKFAIRDDDTSFFTKPEDLKKAYDFVKDGVISLSVVPSAVPIHRDDIFPYGENIEYGFYEIENNQQLISFLKNKSDRFDILLHGYSHEYKKSGNCWIPEMKWKNEKSLEKEITEGKQRLEKLFDRKITVFVAPNNAINKKAISAIEKSAMDYSGIIHFLDRKITLKYIVNFIKRWTYRFTKKIPYPGVLDYGTHKELIAYTLDDYDRLVYEYNQCKKRNQPFVIYTHYWQVNSDSKVKELLKKIYDYVINNGGELVPLSMCFNDKM